jgi:hypothetical protein
MFSPSQMGGVSKISYFLGVSSLPDSIEDIAKKCEFDTMSMHKNANTPEPIRQLTKPRIHRATLSTTKV